MHDKQMDLSGKKQKVKNEQQLEEGRSELSRGLCGFDAEIFDGVGGGIMKGILTAAQLSGTEEKGKASHAAPGSSITFGTKDDTKQKKEFDLDKACINLKVFIRKQIDILKEQLSKVQEQVNTSSQLATVAFDVPNLEEYAALLERRHHFMQIMLLTYAEKDRHGGAARLELQNITVEEFNRTETDGRNLQTVIDQVDTWLDETPAIASSVASSCSGNGGPSQSVEKRIATGEKLMSYSKIVERDWGICSWRCKLAFKKCSWDVEESKFIQPVDLEELKALLMHLHVCLQSEARLASAVQKSLDAQHPLPLPDMESVVSLASLEFDEAVAKVASNEDETKSLEQSVTSSVTAMTALVKKVKEAAADVKKIIEKKQQDQVKAQEKQEKQKIKDQEKSKKSRQGCKRKGQSKGESQRTVEDGQHGKDSYH